MSQTEKARLYQLLKDAGVNFDKHYRDYSTGELKAAVDKLNEQDSELPSAEFFGMAEAVAEQQAPPPEPPLVQPKRQDEMAGERLNQKNHEEPIRVDEQGLVWLQEEVRKPATPKPRGRRVLTYTDTGTETKTAKNGQYTETFEVAGKGPGKSAQVKITLPSYQVGIYRDPRFPFKMYTYNEKRGFDLFEVNAYYGGSELVPQEIKRTYVENVLCYDVRTVVRAIQTEFRQMQLSGRMSNVK